MSHPNNNDVDATNTSDNEIINNTVNSFLHNITSSIYNNTFLDVDDSNTILNDAFTTGGSQPQPPDIESPLPPPIIEPPPPPPPPRTSSNIRAVGRFPFNLHNIGGSDSNRYLLHPTSISFRDFLPNGTYDNSRYVNITPIMFTSRNTNSVLNSVIQQSFNEDGSVFKQVISDEGKDMLKTVPFSTLDTEETKCTIMQEQFEDNTMVIELPCKHVFCEEAIMHWLENESSSCPVCRTKLPSKEIRTEKNCNDDGISADNGDSANNVRNIGVNEENGDNEEYGDNRSRARSFSAPTPLNNNVSEYYRSIINNITRIRDIAEEEDTQRAIWNSIATSSS